MTDLPRTTPHPAGSGRTGHPIRGAIFGLLLGSFVMLDLLLTGVLALDSVMVYVVPVLGLLVGIGLGAWAPIRLGPR